MLNLLVLLAVLFSPANATNQTNAVSTPAVLAPDPAAPALVAAPEARPLEEVLFAMLEHTAIVAPPKGTEETEDQRRGRLRSIADDAVAVAREVSPDHVVSSSLLLLAVAHHESGFAIDVDFGPCREGACGRAACLIQIEGNQAERVKLFSDRRYCFRTGLRALLTSRLSACPDEAHRFAAYAAGDCEKGAKGSRELNEYWSKWRAAYALEKAK